MTKKELEAVVIEQNQAIMSLKTGIEQFIYDIDTMMKKSSDISSKDLGSNLSKMVTELEYTANTNNVSVDFQDA